MTDDLKDLLHETADVRFATPDLGAITKAGDRAVRRRRVRVGLAGAAAVALVGVGVTVVGPGLEQDSPTAVADGAIDSSEVTWVEGSRLYSPDDSVELGFEVRSYVRTTAGFAFVDTDGVVHAYVDGDLSTIGRTSAQARRVAAELVGDDDGTTVAWVSADEPDLVVHDLATDSDHRVPLGPDGMDEEALAMQSYALDGTRLYIGGPDRFDVVDLDAGTSQPVGNAAGEGAFLLGAEDGLVARLAETRGGGDIGAELVDDAGNRVALYRNAVDLALSPDASWVAMHDGTFFPELAEVGGDYRMYLESDYRTDVHVALESAAFQWLSPDVLAVAMVDEEGAVTVHTCQVPSAGCQKVADAGSLGGSDSGLVLPDGRSWRS